MTEAEDRVPLWLKRKAITTLLPYAVWQERDGRPEMFNTILLAARASKMPGFMWDHVTEFISTLFTEASPRATLLVSPHIPWYFLTDRRDLIQWWITAASIVPHTEEVAQGVVDALLQIASSGSLLQHITAEAWSWLTRRPSLPPVCKGRHLGTCRPVVEAVRSLNDIEVLKSYFLLVWSEWNYLRYDGFDNMRTSILVDFGGIEMGHHRGDLIQRLGHVLKQLDRGPEYLAQHNPGFDEDDVRRRKDQYRKLREILLGANIEAISRTPHVTIPTLRVLTLTLDTHRIPHSVYVCTPSPVSVVTRLDRSIPPFYALFTPLLWYHPPDSLCQGLSLLILSSLSRHRGGLRFNLL